MGIHTFFVLLVWERSAHSQRSLRCASLTDAPIPPGVLSRGRSGSRSPRLWSRCCRGTAKAAVLEFAYGSVSGGRERHRLIYAFTWQVQCFVSGFGSMRCGFFRPDRGTYTAAIWFWGIGCCQCKRYWGFATSVLCLWGAGWGCDESGWEIMYWLASTKGRRSFNRQTWQTLFTFSCTTSMPGITIFPDFHTEVSRSWEKAVAYRVYSTQASHYSSLYIFTFTFMHLADAFIQSDLQLHSDYTFSLVCVFPGNRTHNLLRCWRNALPLSHTVRVGVNGWGEDSNAGYGQLI